MDTQRTCMTVGGRGVFEVEGAIETGLRIWMGTHRTSVRFPAEFLSNLLGHFRGRTVRIGSKFDDPGEGSLGDYIQKNLPTKMNPAVYLGGLLIDEGYAEKPKRGYLHFFESVQPPKPTPPVEASQRLQQWAAQLDAATAQQVMEGIESSDAPNDAQKLLDALGGIPNITLPTLRGRDLKRFNPVKLQGGDLSEDVVRDRR